MIINTRKKTHGNCLNIATKHFLKDILLTIEGNSNARTATQCYYCFRGQSASFIPVRHEGMRISFSREPSNCHTVEYILEVILSIYRFKIEHFLSENVIFECKTCIQSGHHIRSLPQFLTSDYGYVMSDW